MNAKKAGETIARLGCFIVVMSIMVACDNRQVMMHGKDTMSMVNWNWGQFLISLGLGLLIGFVIGLYVPRKK